MAYEMSGLTYTLLEWKMQVSLSVQNLFVWTGRFREERACVVFSF